MEFRQFNVLSGVLIVFLILLQYRLWFESGGMIDMMRLKRQVTVEQQKNEALKKRNQKTLLEVQHLQKNRDTMEARARQELGMIKKGETFYQVVGDAR